MAELTDKDIKAIECRFAVHCLSTNNVDDLHAIKEIIHYNDGTVRPNLRLVKNYKRDFYIVQKGQRDFNDKKEYIELNRCIKYSSTQVDLVNAISRAIEEPWFRGNLRKRCRNPYIYGADILSTAVIKKTYQMKYPDTNTFYSMAAFDIETDVNFGTEEIIMATMSFKNKMVTVIKESFLEGYSDPINRLQKLLQKYLGKKLEERKIIWEIILVKSEAEIVTNCFKKAHEWMPDFVAIWNMDFDLPKCITALEKAGIRPEKVFCDPNIPPEFRHFSYAQGGAQKVTASGKTTPIKPAARWHTVYTPASFYFIDAMCAYKHIRIGSAEEASYALEAILQKHLGIGKLDFKEAEHLDKLEWHQFMQAKYPLEYVIYNTFDCIRMEELDEEISDLSLTLPLFSGCSDFANFKSQPRRLADNLHWYALENGKVFGTTSDEMSTDLDKKTIGLDGWIVTLPANLVVDNGLQIIKESPELHTNARAHVGD